MWSLVHSLQMCLYLHLVPKEQIPLELNSAHTSGAQVLKMRLSLGGPPVCSDFASYCFAAPARTGQSAAKWDRLSHTELGKAVLLCL